MNELLNTRRASSVAETLEQARQALKIHRTWMQSRSTVAPGPGEELATEPPPLNIFTSKENESPKSESAILLREDVKMKQAVNSPAPPSSAAAKKQVSKVTPADPSLLPRPLTEIPLQFYGTENTEQLATEESKKQLSNEGGNKDVLLPRKRGGGGVSKSRVAPLSSDAEDRIGAPTSPVGVFYGKFPGKITRNGWTDKPSQTSLTETPSASSGDQIHHQRILYFLLTLRIFVHYLSYFM